MIDIKCTKSSHIYVKYSFFQGPDGTVELVPNSNVYVPATTLQGIQSEHFTRGSKLVRRLVHAIFSDEELAVSSCLGSGASQKGLDRPKLEAIKGRRECLICKNLDFSVFGEDFLCQSSSHSIFRFLKVDPVNICFQTTLQGSFLHSKLLSSKEL